MKVLLAKEFKFMKASLKIVLSGDDYVFIGKRQGHCFYETLPCRVVGSLHPFILFYEKVILAIPNGFLSIDISKWDFRIIPISSSLTVASKLERKLEITWFSTFTKIRLDKGRNKQTYRVKGDPKFIEISHGKKIVKYSHFESPDIIDAELRNECDIGPKQIAKVSKVRLSFNFFVCHYRRPAYTTCAAGTVVYLHGGPREKWTMEYNALVHASLERKFDVLVPVYPGDLVEDNKANSSIEPWSLEYIRKLGLWIERLQQKSKTPVVVVAHSCGVYIAMEVAKQGCRLKNLVTINGVFDWNTLQSLCPHRIERAPVPQAVGPRPLSRFEHWTHMQDVLDPVIPYEIFKKSLSQAPYSPEELVEARCAEHEISPCLVDKMKLGEF